MNRQISNQQSGFTMIEMLVALVILSVGLLGIAALQTRGQQFNHEAYVHTQATFLVYDLSDRMRNNLAQAQAGGYVADSNSQPNSETDCRQANCAPNQLRDYDLASWFALIEENLPDGQAEITFSNSVYTIVVTWSGQELQDGQYEVKRQSWGVRV